MSTRLFCPSGPSNVYCFSTACHGIRRRCAASASLARITSFSLTRISCLAASHSCGETMGGVFIGIVSLRYSRQCIRSAGLDTRPLRNGSTVGSYPLTVVGDRSDGPARRRVLPCLLAPVHGEVHQREAVVHLLHAAVVGPVGLEDPVAVA